MDSSFCFQQKSLLTTLDKLRDYCELSDGDLDKLDEPHNAILLNPLAHETYPVCVPRAL
jgi:hypothetical protein